jgi:hypothetical protein
MLRQGHIDRNGKDGFLATYLSFHGECAYAEGWGSDWAQIIDLPANQHNGSAHPVDRHNGASITRTKARRLRLVVSDIEAGEGYIGLDDTLETLRWQRPTAFAGYVAHREQFI